MISLPFSVICLFVISQSQDPQGFSVSMFQFDPNQLGIFHTEHKHKKAPGKRAHTLRHHNHTLYRNGTTSNATKKSILASNATDVLRNSTSRTLLSRQDNHPDNSTANATTRGYESFLNPNPRPSNETNSTVSLAHGNPSVGNHSASVNKNLTIIQGNPGPSDEEAQSHLEHPILDAVPVKNFTNNTLISNPTLNNSNTQNATVTRNATNELLFFRNKTTHLNDGSDKTTSLKLTKVETPLEPERIININATKSSNASRLLNTTRLSNSSKVIKHTNGSLTNLNPAEEFNATALTNSSNNIQEVQNNKNATSAEERRRGEILSHFIPSMEARSKQFETFQLGVKRQEKHDLHPECYTCPKNSTFTQCVKKSTLQKCQDGLDNICYSRSYRGDTGNKSDVISYEMGCSSHNMCQNAKPFPCRGE